MQSSPGYNESVKKNAILWKCCNVYQIHNEPPNAVDVVKAFYQSPLDEYDDDANYIGNNPKDMDQEDWKWEDNWKSNTNTKNIKYKKKI